MPSKLVAASLLAVVLVVLLTACVADLRGHEGPDGPRSRTGDRRGIGPSRQFAEDEWRHYDLNGDGIITRPEFMAARSHCFTRFDLNGDGILTRTEVRRLIPTRLEERFEAAFSRMDRDGTGGISQGGFERESIRLFQQLDTNGDGVIAGYEFYNMTAVLQDDICSERP